MYYSKPLEPLCVIYGYVSMEKAKGEKKRINERELGQTRGAELRVLFFGASILKEVNRVLPHFICA